MGASSLFISVVLALAMNSDSHASSLYGLMTVFTLPAFSMSIRCSCSNAEMVSQKYNDPWLKRRLTIPNPKITSLYCLPKIHKNPIAMRPIASNINTPTEKLAQLMLDIVERYPVKHAFSRLVSRTALTSLTRSRILS